MKPSRGLEPQGLGRGVLARAGQPLRVLAFDDFERASLGANWTVAYPTPNGGVVAIVNGCLARNPASSSFYIIDYTGVTFAADQWCEATYAANAPMTDEVNAVNVRRDPAQSPAPRYIACYDFGDTGDEEFNGKIIIKYDGVAPEDTEYMASVDFRPLVAGDRIRLEIVGFTLRCYVNGVFVLGVTDTLQRITTGRPGMCGRRTFSDGVGSLPGLVTVEIWSDFAAGNL